MGRKGQKTGAGMYSYEPGSRQALHDDVTAKVIAEERKDAGFKQRKIGVDEIIARCLYPLVLEGGQILEEGVALRPGDLDVVWLTGYGFPAWRGGPMWWADQVGLQEIVKSAGTFAKAHGPRWWHVGPLITALASRGQGFDEYYREAYPTIYG